MIVTLEQIPHNDTPLDKPYLCNIKLKTYTLTGVAQIQNKIITILVVDPYYSIYDINDVYSVLDQWYENGHDVPVTVEFEKAKLKYLSVPLIKAVHISMIHQIDGTIFDFSQNTIKKQQSKVDKKH